jgi:DNA-binding NarL/FixJ family response regulator
VIRVVVVDDQQLVRAGIVMLVNAEEDIAVVAEAADGQDALIQVRAQRAGASGFLLKYAAPAEMINAIHAVVAGSGLGLSGLRPSAGESSG